MPGKTTSPVQVYQLKVTLQDGKPPIWRSIQISADVRLNKLHRVMQVLFDWTDSHLHQFIVGNERSLNVQYYSASTDRGHDMEDCQPEEKVCLNEVLITLKSKIVYEYDFGDSWRHNIVLEKVLVSEPGVKYPRCLAGKRSAPPEDCGGIWGYAEMLQALVHPGDEDDDMFAEMAPEDFDPEAFDLDAVNAAIRRIR